VADTNFQFRPPESFTAIKAAGVDVVNMANNLALAYGPIGPEDTFDATTSSELPVVGIGHDASDAYWSHRHQHQPAMIFGAVA
jgi:poly-gamma-glutamate capsule biosynthesis protein CapA/YwtB (metallophosphatase superfamily)